MDNESDERKDDLWRRRLQQVVGDHGGPATVARLSDIPPQTLKNHLSGRTKKAPLENLRQIAAACGVSFAWLAAVDEPARAVDGDRSRLVADGLAEPEVVRYDGPPIVFPPKVPANRGRWTVRTRALDLAGVLPGDVIEFDLGAAPATGEPVVAQVYDDVAGTAETVLRLFHPPFLMVRSSDPAVDPRPLQLDTEGQRVKVVGAFVRLHRAAR